MTTCSRDSSESGAKAVWPRNVFPSSALAFTLAAEVEARRQRAPAAVSLLKAWSAKGWTQRQSDYAAVLVRQADPVEGRARAVPPYTYSRGGPWWHDVRPQRQALRGRKSGIMRRWATRDRDLLIHRWYRTGKFTVTEMAAHFELTRQGIYYVLRRTVSAALAKIEPVKRTIRKVQRMVLGELPKAYPVDSLETGHAELRLFTVLRRWLALNVVREAPDSRVRAEAERLNAESVCPMRDGRVKTVLRAVLAKR